MAMVEKAAQWLAERKLPNQDCPSCGPTQWLLQKRPVGLPSLSDDGLPDETAGRVVAVTLICLTCTQMIFFSTAMMGIDTPA
jgi:hypothetical protein